MEAVHLLFPQISGIATENETKLYTTRCIWDEVHASLNLQQLVVLYIIIVAALVHSQFTNV